jgi:hypothetical protein
LTGVIHVHAQEGLPPICSLGYDMRTTLKDLRKMVKAKTGNKDFVFTYPDGIRIHPKQEKKLKVLTFGSRINVLLLARSTTGTVLS